jgi:hypothetical protein
VPDNLRPMIETGAAGMGLSVQEYLLLSYKLTFKVLLLVSIFYQGGLGLYYLRRRDAAVRAFAPDAET